MSELTDKFDKLKKSRNEIHLKTKVDTYQKKLEIDKKRWKKEQVKESNASSWKNISYIGSHGVNFFSLILVILIGVSLIRILKGGSGDIVTFGSLLDLLRDAPQISSEVLTFVEQIEIIGDWGVFNFLRDFINDLVDLWSVLIWLGSSIVDLIIYIFYFLRWIFV